MHRFRRRRQAQLRGALDGLDKALGDDGAKDGEEQEEWEGGLGLGLRGKAVNRMRAVMDELDMDNPEAVEVGRVVHSRRQPWICHIF